VLELSALEGGAVKVHPLTLRGPLAGVGSLSQYRIVFGAGELRVEAVLRGANGQQVRGEIEARLEAALAEQGVQAPPILVESVAEIPRHPRSGKHKAIEVQGA